MDISSLKGALTFLPAVCRVHFSLKAELKYTIHRRRCWEKNWFLDRRLLPFSVSSQKKDQTKKWCIAAIFYAGVDQS